MNWLLDLMLVLLVAMPLLSGVVLVLLPDLTKSMVRVFSLLATLATFVLSLIGACFFDWSNPAALSFVKSVEWVGAFGLQFGFGVNAISMWLVLLTTFLMPLVVLGSFSAIQDRVKEFFLWLLILESAMLGVFVATDIVFFHICFEFTLIPLYFLIGIYGSAQRLKAARVFFLYTFTGSMLTFAGLLYVAWRCDWVFSIATLYELAPQRLSEIEQAWVMGAMLAGFAVKVPLFPLHTWLPLAHTEAPTAGSVILAGVLLKLVTSTGNTNRSNCGRPVCADHWAVGRGGDPLRGSYLLGTEGYQEVNRLLFGFTLGFLCIGNVCLQYRGYGRFGDVHD